MSYRIDYSKEAYQDIRDIPTYFRNRIRAAIDALQEDARPLKSKELRDLPGIRRIRLDIWRIIYNIDDENAEILIIRIKRKTGPETYENLIES